MMLRSKDLALLKRGRLHHIHHSVSPRAKVAQFLQGMVNRHFQFCEQQDIALLHEQISCDDRSFSL